MNVNTMENKRIFTKQKSRSSFRWKNLVALLNTINKNKGKQNMDGQLYCEAHVPITKPPLSPETDDK
ncbi:Hypothetical predicted protein, partial [Mytilus galloprovincialis]